MPRKAVSERASPAAIACMAASDSGGTGGAGRRMTAARFPELAVPGVVKAAAVRRGRGGRGGAWLQPQGEGGGGVGGRWEGRGRGREMGGAMRSGQREAA